VTTTSPRVEVDTSPHTSAPRLLEFVQSELAKEEARRTSIESRGLAVVTVTSGLITLVAAVRQLSGTTNPEVVTTVARILTIASGGLLILGILAAACTNVPRRYRLIDPDALRKAAPRYWALGEDDLDRALFASQLVFLEDAQRTNDARARLLFVALILLGLGVIGMAASSLVPWAAGHG
jgi:hypothetical protein